MGCSLLRADGIARLHVTRNCSKTERMSPFSSAILQFTPWSWDCLSACQAENKTWAESLFFPLGDKFRDFTTSPSLCSLLQLFLDPLVWLLLLSGQSCSANDHFPLCLPSVNILQNRTSASRSSEEQQRKGGSCSEPGWSCSNSEEVLKLEIWLQDFSVSGYWSRQ